MITGSLVSAVLLSTPVAAQSYVDAERDGLVLVVGVPPSPGSAAFAADLEAVLIAQMHRSDIEAYAAAFDGELSARQWAEMVLGKDFGAADYPAAYALFDAVRADMTRVVDVVKAKGPQRSRPHMDDPRVRPSLSVEGHGSNSWPSGRAAATRVWAGVLADIFPNGTRDLAFAAERSAALRLIGGVHYPSDLVAGKRLADQFLLLLRANPDYRRQLAMARSAAERPANPQ
jgi:acid phosphatase (class A)